MIYSALPGVLSVLCMVQLINLGSEQWRCTTSERKFSFETTGRLEIYLDGEWGTFCANGFNTFVGDAACRQLGYDGSEGKISRASDFVDYVPLASNSTPIHLSNDYNRCSGYSCNGPVHIDASQKVLIRSRILPAHTAMIPYFHAHFFLSTIIIMDMIHSCS